VSDLDLHYTMRMDSQRFASPIRRLIAIVMTLAVALSAIGTAFAQSPTPQPPSLARGEYVPGEVLVKFKSSLTGADAQVALAEQGLDVAGSIAPLDVFKLAVAPGRELETVASLRARADVLYAEPNYLVYAQETIPDDPGYVNQWGLPKISAPQAWDIISTTGGAGVVIAIVDSGIDLTHPDFACADKLVPGYDFVNGDGDPQDDNGHGSHVAGIASACSDNTIGVAGVAWTASLMPVKILDASGSGSFANLASGITYAVDHGANIINLSLGAANGSQVMADAIQYAEDQGVLIAAAAGNCAQGGGTSCSGLINPPIYPAAYTSTVAVAATDVDDSHASFSEIQPYVDVSAPGVSIYSTVPGDYWFKTGTSMATPFVSGLAALIWSLAPGLTLQEVRAQIESSADDLGQSGRDDTFGYGRINARRALKGLVKVRVSLASSVFIVDDQRGPLPASSQAELVSDNEQAVTWTASVSPTVTWLSIVPPTAGVVSAAAPASFTLTATRPVTYGLHYATVIISASALSVPVTATVSINYVPRLGVMHLPMILKQ
jgi:thermitase